ncbi:uncharacterized protein BJ212DRAFT_630837 [Suillus subaureus]|uniref:RNA-directed DNA polymerase n=1 Tax=Suillus subaureus TaxID=48587 RepID=A0A9P7J911_9AGAM|nr:uncharacterized protein BJ212DRAFT_630837 [Suillus subaureus]KAG1808931.1 hypothetical protein BJ212DRAFT_630837 [Suillus subaureus]
MKMHHYLMTWGINVAKNTKLLRDAIGHTARCAYSTICRQSSSKTSDLHGGTCDVQKSSVIWLGMHAFYTVLSKKPEIYGTSTLLKYLRFEVSLSRNKRLRRRLGNVVKDGLSGVAALNF